MDDIKKCSKRGNKSSKSNFHKTKTKNDGLKSDCKVSRKNCYNLNQNRKSIYQKEYNEQNSEKRNLFIKNRTKTHVNFRLIRKTRSKICHALNSNL